MIGREFFGYVIESKIGDGGMAVVYKARHKSLTNTFRAIKVLNPALAMDPVIRAKFKTEAQTMATLNHPNIVKVENYAEEGHELCLIMEFIEGHPLDYMLRQVTGPLPELRLKILFSAILDGFTYAHSKGIIHRDIKPANIIIAPGDVPKIIDFGIVKIVEDGSSPGSTKTGTRIGTPMFMSPEQIHARPVDRRSDVYALGVTLFYMLTGRPPYSADTNSEFEILQMVVNDPLPKAKLFYPPVSNHMQALVDKATQKQKENRFADCAEFKAALLDGNFTGPGTGPAASTIRAFTVTSTSIKKGEYITLSWDITNMANAQITGLGNLATKQGTVTVSPVEPTTYTLTVDGEQKALFVDVKKTNSNNAVLIWLSVIIGIALVVWGLIAANKSKDDPQTYVSNSVSQAYLDSVAAVNAMPALDTSSTMTTDSSTDYTSTNTSNVSDYESEQVNRVIKNRTEPFNGAIYQEDIDNTLNNYASIVGRYYDVKYVDHERLRKFHMDYFTKSVRQSRWVVDTGKSKFYKNADGTYDIDLYGDYYIYYQYTTTKFDPNKEYHLYLHNHYQLNSYFKILQEYTIDRTEMNY